MFHFYILLFQKKERLGLIQVNIALKCGRGTNIKF